MKRVSLVHLNQDDAKQCVERLKEAGYDVAYSPDVRATIRELKAKLPDAVVIALDRTPSAGRYIALIIRKHGATRHVPLVFTGGAPEKVERVKQALPDAEFTTWSRIRSALKRAFANPPAAPVVPRSVMDGYAGTPLPKKLGIKAGMVVATVGAPDDFGKTLGDLPTGVTLRGQARGKCDLLIWFCRSGKDLRKRIGKMAARDDSKSLWIAWPKKTAKLASDLTQQHVRETGLASGLVDYKICSIDDTWSGLLFTRRKAK